jgi:hypothetical protein
MIEAVNPFCAGDRVRWIKGSRLAGATGTVAESGCIWSFVNVDHNDQQEYTRTALLRKLKSN